MTMRAVGTHHLGREVDGYHLSQLIGRGGMSAVYLGEAGDKRVAVKILHPNLPKDIQAGPRLRQEAEAIARIAHPNVVHLEGWGQIDGLPYLIMEHLEGASLKARPQREIPGLLRVIDQVLDALERAHELEIIHRDLKPENIFLLGPEGAPARVKILDFGIAKILGDGAPDLVQTAHGLFLGTPEYLPPELAMGERPAPTSDIYSLGVVLYEQLTGRLPFTGKSATEIVERHCFTPPTPPRALAPHIPPGLEAILLKALHKEPKERYPSAAALREALSPFAVERPVPHISAAPSESVVDGLNARDERFGADLEARLREEITALWGRRPPPLISADLVDLATISEALEEVKRAEAIVSAERSVGASAERLDLERAQKASATSKARAAAVAARLAPLVEGLDARLDALFGGALGTQPSDEAQILERLSSLSRQNSEEQALFAQLQDALRLHARRLKEEARAEVAFIHKEALATRARLQERLRRLQNQARLSSLLRRRDAALLKLMLDLRVLRGGPKD